LPLVSALWGVALFSYLFGLYSSANDLAPARFVYSALRPAKKLVAGLIGRVSVPYAKTSAVETVETRAPADLSPGLTLISGVGPKGTLFAKLIDAKGVARHSWDLDWFTHWPNPDHVPEAERPKQRPGTHVHGMVLSPNGDLTYNYEYLGLIKVDACGRVKWRLPRQTHHSLFEDEQGALWTADTRITQTPRADLPGYKPPYFTYAILQVSPEGKILQEIDVFDLFKRNHLMGLLYQSSVNNDAPISTGDTLHLNNVTVFPTSMKPGLFKPGDIMVSFRNINAIIVFDPKTRLVRAQLIGRFVRQHDSRFVDGSTISVFDNNNVGAPPDQGASRIVEYSFADGTEKVLFEGDAAHPFYSYIMGKQHRLANGNLLVTESVKGRVLEVDDEGRVIWTYNNIVKPGIAGLVEDAQRIAPDVLSEASVARISAQCATTAKL